MMRRFLVLAFCIVLTGVLAGSIYAEEMDSFFKTVCDPTRNDYSGVTGIEFTANEDINVLAIGRPVTSTFTQDHTVTLWRTADQEKVAEVVVGPNSAVYEVENGNYAYAMLDAPVMLPAGETYRLMSEEFAGGDNWATCSWQLRGRTSQMLPPSTEFPGEEPENSPVTLTRRPTK